MRGNPAAGTFDLQTVIIHELGHAHLLQHNNNPKSVMYFQLSQQESRRYLDSETDRYGGSSIVERSVYDAEVCSSERMDFFNDTDCNLGVVNSVQEAGTLKLVVAPNPSNGNFTVNGIEEGQSFVITDLSGRTVYINGQNSGGLVNVNLTNLQPGVYILQVIGAESPQGQKLIIQ